MADSVSDTAAREAPPAESSASPNSANQNGGAPQSKLALALRALRHRNFQLFFGGQFISLIGTWMQTVAESWLVYRLTGSALMLGVVGFSSQIPVFLLSPIGGLVADRYNRRRVVMATQSAAMVLAGIYATLILGGWIQVWQIITLAAALGVVNAFDIPARQAFLVEMVGKEDLLNAIALNSSMFNGARVVGPAVAGVLVAWIGEGWCFAANSLSYIAVIVGLRLMSVTAREIAGEGSVIEHIKEGFHYAQHTMPIRALLLLVGLVSLVGMPYSVLMPVFADQVLHGGARGLGLLMGATGVGAMLGALTLAMRAGVKGLGRVAALSGGFFGVFLVIFSFSRYFWLSLAVLIPVGFTMMLQMACSNTLIQAMVPDRLRGRVMSLYSMMFMGMAPLGALFGGSLAEKIGAPWTVATGGVLSVVGAIWFYTQLPALRIEARQLIIAQGMAGGEPAEQMTARLR